MPGEDLLGAFIIHNRFSPLTMTANRTGVTVKIGDHAMTTITPDDAVRMHRWLESTISDPQRRTAFLAQTPYSALFGTNTGRAVELQLADGTMTLLSFAEAKRMVRWLSIQLGFGARPVAA